MSRTALTCTCIASSAILASAALLTAGPLTPPVGSVAGTYKTLQQVEPRTDIATVAASAGVAHLITQPGSYYLTADLVLTPGITGINISTDDVTLDLNGFEIRGPSSSGPAISVFTGNRLRVFNGSIAGCATGIDATSSQTGRIDRITVTTAGSSAINVGRNFLVTDCTVADSGTAFAANDNSMFRGCTSFGGNIGFGLGSGCRMEHCRAGNAALNAVSSAGGNTIADCSLNSASLGSGDGILANGNNDVIKEVVLYGFNRGIVLAGPNNTVIRNNFQAVNTPITGAGLLVAPVISNASGATNPLGNTWR